MNSPEAIWVNRHGNRCRKVVISLISIVSDLHYLKTNISYYKITHKACLVRVICPYLCNKSDFEHLSDRFLLPLETFSEEEIIVCPAMGR
jgi:hypothetical protein